MPGKLVNSPALFLLGTLDTALAELAAAAEQLQLRIRHWTDERELIAQAVDQAPECLVIDLDRFPHASQLQMELNQGSCPSIVIAIGTQLDVDTAIEVMERGALTLLRKPLQQSNCERYLSRAVQLARQQRELHFTYRNFIDKQAGLSSRQQDILWSVLAGLPTKAIAAKLDVSNRLVELERSRLLKVFQSESTTELALKVGEFLMLQRTLALPRRQHFARLRYPVDSRPPHSPDNG